MLLCYSWCSIVFVTWQPYALYKIAQECFLCVAHFPVALNTHPDIVSPPGAAFPGREGASTSQFPMWQADPGPASRIFFFCLSSVVDVYEVYESKDVHFIHHLNGDSSGREQRILEWWDQKCTQKYVHTN